MILLLICQRCYMHKPEHLVLEKDLLNLIQANREASLMERFFPFLPPVALIPLPSTPRLTYPLPLLPLRNDFLVFPEEIVEGNSQLVDFTDELEFRFDLFRDRPENWVRRGVLEEGDEGSV